MDTTFALLAVAGSVTCLVATGLLLLGAVALDEYLHGTGPPQEDPSPTENIRRIGAQARQTMDRASASFLRRVEHLFQDQSRR